MRCGVYAHVPFCRRRCPYCDFYFEVAPEDPRFADALVAEWAARAGELPSRPSTLYFGGGTPSHVAPATIAGLIEAVRTGAGLDDDAEITLEANPEDVDDARAAAWAGAGVNRVSLGVQSFDDDVLAWLGRAHDGAGARAAIAALRAAGIGRVSIDLIVGVPGERATRLVDDVDVAAATGAGHVSAYLLSVEPGTPLVSLIARGKRAAIDDDRQADAYESLQDVLPARGYAQYEVSSYARPGDESRHNRLYWAQGAYVGLGPGAHSLALRDDGSVARRHTTARLPAWLSDPTAPGDVEVLAPPHALVEAIAFGLRDLHRGVDTDALAARHRTQPWPALRAALAGAAARGFLVVDGARARLTSRGALFADAVARDVLASRDERI